jgi:hypothetical protein
MRDMLDGIHRHRPDVANQPRILLTLITIRLIPALEGWFGRRWAFSFLTVGPINGLWAMLAL